MAGLRSCCSAARTLNSTTKQIAGQGNCSTTLRHLRRPGREVSAGGGASANGRCWSRRSRETLACVQREAPMSVRLADVIDVLDEAYPPRLAQSWDSVGLVCGDPDDVAGLGDRRDRRDTGGRRRGSRRRSAAGASSAAAARGRHGRGQHAQGRADAPADPNRAFAVHRPHQRRLGMHRACPTRWRRRSD